jgi:2-haloacid dehalogenase
MIEGVIFDAYGTLFDVHSVTEECNKFFPDNGEEISQIWRQKQLEYTWLRALMERYVDFEEINRDALRFVFRQLKLEGNKEAMDSLLAAYLKLKSFPEVEEALKIFHPKQMVILSNGTPMMLKSVVQHNGFQDFFKEIISVDGLKTYKPDPQVYQLAVSKLGLSKGKILFVSSNGWDVAGSKSFGFTVGWINRQGKASEELGVRPDFTVSNLLELANHMS